MTELTKAHHRYAADLAVEEADRRAKLMALPEEIRNNLLTIDSDRPEYEPLPEEL